MLNYETLLSYMTVVLIVWKEVWLLCVTVCLCCAGERLGMVEAQCERVRMLYRDCARPPPPPLQTDRRQVGFTVASQLIYLLRSTDFNNGHKTILGIFH